MEKIVLPLPSKQSSSKNSIIISSYVCIARNIDALFFPEKLSKKEKSLIEKQIAFLLSQSYPDEFIITNIKKLESSNKLQLIADLNITEHFLEHGETFFAKKDGTWVILPNEYDHLHVFSIAFGQNLQNIYKNVNSLVLSLDPHIHFAYTPKLGFATSNITYAGNGLYLSLMINLTGLELQGTIDTLTKTCLETGYNLIPYTSHPNSGLFLLKNNGSFGISELDHIDHMIKFAKKLEELELIAKKELLADNENKELFISQVHQFLNQGFLSYPDMCQLISLVDFLNHSLYIIHDRHRWLEQLFRLKNHSAIFAHITNFEEFDSYRSQLLNHLFSQLVTFK